MTITHRLQLPSLMKHLGLPMKAVELGVAEGLFSRDLLENGIELLFSVDVWQTLDQKGDASSDSSWHINNYNNAVKLLSPFGNKSVIIRGLSYEMSDLIDNSSLGLVYVDCDHSLESVRKDIVAWYPKLVNGGIMSFHDFEMPQYGVKQAVQEFAEENNLEIHLLPENAVKDAGAYFFKKIDL